MSKILSALRRVFLLCKETLRKSNGFPDPDCVGSTGRAAGGVAAGGGLPAQALIIRCAWPKQRDDVPVVPITKDSPVCLPPGRLGVTEVPNHGNPWEGPGFCVGTV